MNATIIIMEAIGEFVGSYCHCEIENQSIPAYLFVSRGRRRCRYFVENGEIWRRFAPRFYPEDKVVICNLNDPNVSMLEAMAIDLCRLQLISHNAKKKLLQKLIMEQQDAMSGRSDLVATPPNSGQS